VSSPPSYACLVCSSVPARQTPRLSPCLQRQIPSHRRKTWFHPPVVRLPPIALGSSPGWPAIPSRVSPQAACPQHCLTVPHARKRADVLARKLASKALAKEGSPSAATTTIHAQTLCAIPPWAVCPYPKRVPVTTAIHAHWPIIASTTRARGAIRFVPAKTMLSVPSGTTTIRAMARFHAWVACVRSCPAASFTVPPRRAIHAKARAAIWRRVNVKQTWPRMVRPVPMAICVLARIRVRAAFA
jgi:hypothetical protein